MSDLKVDETLLDLTQSAWARYLEAIDAMRPELYRYCRRLTGNPWDAEDLVHDALERTFARFGNISNGLANPRAYLLRVASNLWITQQRRERVAAASADPSVLAPQAAPPPESQSELRDAGAVLLSQLSPQERAAVLLKECFDFTLEEIAEVLGTTVGAVKAALHGGRVRLSANADTQPARNSVSPEVVDRFVERYNARDLPGMLALMLDHAAIEMLGAEQQVGRAAFARKRSWFYYNLWNPLDGKPTTAVWRTASYNGVPVVLVLAPRDGVEVLTSVMRIDTEDGGVSRIHVYAMCPDTVREVAAGLGLPCGTWGVYRFPPELAARFKEAARRAEAEGG